MKTSTRAVILAGLVLAGAVAIGATPAAVEPDATGWDAKAAAKYLDARAEFWSTWPNASRDRGTFCISCHTTLPFAIARPALRGSARRTRTIAAESKILEQPPDARAQLARHRAVLSRSNARHSQDQRIARDRSGDECARAVAARRARRPLERRRAHRARRDVGAADEDRSEQRRVDVAELQLRAMGVAQLAVLRRVARGARRRLGARCAMRPRLTFRTT